MTQPFFSIIIPTYNRSSFITKAIESVMNQTFTNWELIIIDDGSKDDTKEVIERYIQKDNRITYYYQTNAERSAARNHGISKAKGKWICFLDSDDYYLTNHLQNFYTFLEKNNFNKGIYFCGVTIETGSKKEIVNKYKTNNANNIEFVFENILGTPRACVSKNILDNDKFDTKLSVGEDTELWVRIAEKNKVFFESFTSFVQVNHDQRTVTMNDFASSIDNLVTLKNILKLNASKRISFSKKRIALSNAYFSVGLHHLFKKRRFKALFYFSKSLISKIKHPQAKFKLNIILQLISFRKMKKILVICQ